MSAGDAAKQYPCRSTHCVVEKELHPGLDVGRSLPEVTSTGIPVLQLAPTACTRCDLWASDRHARQKVAEVHRAALYLRGDPRAELIGAHLQRARHATRRASSPAAALATALVELQAARRAIEAAGADRDALAPLIEASLTSLLRGVVANPDALFALAGAGEAQPLPDAAWESYLARLAHRVEAEGGRLHRTGEWATVDVRGLRLRLGKERVPDASDGAVPVVVGGENLPAALGRLAPGAVPVLVDIRTGIHDAQRLDAWAHRLLDPRADGELVAEFQQALRREPSPLLTEPFITARDHEAEWPRSVVREALSAFASSGVGRVRDVPTVGIVLVRHEV